MAEPKVYVDGQETILSQFYKPEAVAAGGGGSGLPIGWSPDPTKYHDISAVVVADGVPMANRFPGAGINRTSRGGTIIPRHVPGGGASMGWSPQNPIEVIVDEGMTNRPIRFNSGKVTASRLNSAVERAKQEGLIEPADVGAAAYAILASEQEAAAAQPRADRQPIRGDMSNLMSKPVSFAGIAAKEASAPTPAQPEPAPQPELPSTPQPAPPKARSAVPPLPPSILGSMHKQPAPHIANPASAASAPMQLIKTMFEFPQPVGLFEAYYHGVLATERTVILAYDRNAGGKPWFPVVQQPDDEPSDEPEQPIGLRVFDREGNPDTSFAVLSPVERYVFDIPGHSFEFCLLPLIRAISHKELENEQA